MKQRFSTSHSTEAIVLSHRPYQDADRLVVLLTASSGKIIARARGVRKMNSKKRAYLEPGMLIRCQLIETKGYYTISQLTLLFDPSIAKETLPGMRRLSQVLEIIDRLVIDSEDELVFDHCVNLIQTLETKTPTHTSKLLSQLLELLGYPIQPEHSLLDQVAMLSDKPMRSWDYLRVQERAPQRVALPQEYEL